MFTRLRFFFTLSTLKGEGWAQTKPNHISMHLNGPWLLNNSDILFLTKLFPALHRPIT